MGGGNGEDAFKKSLCASRSMQQDHQPRGNHIFSYTILRMAISQHLCSLLCPFWQNVVNSGGTDAPDLFVINVINR